MNNIKLYRKDFKSLKAFRETVEKLHITESEIKYCDYVEISVMDYWVWANGMYLT